MGRRLLALVIGLLPLGGAGCLVQSHCERDYDCVGNESCNLQTYQCELECVVSQDCWQKTPGFACVANRCVPPGDRVKAQNFCLEVVNPKSAYYQQELCLEQLRGKVVLLFFGLLA